MIMDRYKELVFKLLKAWCKPRGKYTRLLSSWN